MFYSVSVIQCMSASLTQHIYYVKSTHKRRKGHSEQVIHPNDFDAVHLCGNDFESDRKIRFK